MALFENIIHDIHNEEKIAQDNETIEKKRVCELARALFESAVTKEDANNTMEKLILIEPFTEYIDDIKPIYEEVIENGR